MINTILKTDKKNSDLLSIESMLDGVYLLPKWEKIKNIVLFKKRFLMPVQLINSQLFRKFSSKNNIEKYCLKDNNNNVLASVDLRVYKDCVYIINLNVSANSVFSGALNIMLQTAVEKALYNTTNKKLNINLEFSSSVNNKIKKILLKEDFYTPDNQSSYEKEMFGEIYTLDAAASGFWQKKIKQMHILINK